MKTKMFVCIVLGNLNIPILYHMGMGKPNTKLYPNIPRMITCRKCKTPYVNPFKTKGYLSSMCKPCLDAMRAQFKPVKKKRKTRSDKGKKRKKT